MAKKKSKAEKNSAGNKKAKGENRQKLSREFYEDELERLQGELVKLQYWIRKTGQHVVIVFEGRDAAGKGGVIKRIMERLNPRIFKVVALPAPTDREKTQMYIQRYLNHFPAAGEVTIFDRSWYNRLGVEKVMGFCTDEEYERFLEDCPAMEQFFVDEGVTLIKYWFDVGMEEQARRFQGRIKDPRKVWKLSPMDVESYKRWYQYSRARDTMLDATDTEHAPWHVVRSDDKKRARLNCITHLLNTLPYEELPRKKVTLGKRNMKGKYDDEASIVNRRIVPEKY